MMMKCEGGCAGTAGAHTPCMSQLRIAVLLPLISLIGSMTGCYNDAPPQSTFPEEHYMSGPPGGAMDPEPSNAYANDPGAPGYDNASNANDDEDAAPDPAAAPSAIAPSGPAIQAADVAGPDVAGPVDSADSQDDAAPGDDAMQSDAEVSGGIALAPGAEAAPAPTAGVTDVEINAALEGHGQWVENDEYGSIWRPDATQVGVDFTPYESGGSWAYTDAGWGFNCDYSWGWLPFHYGRWAWFQDYWGWVPGYQWAPAWVEWRHGGGVVGWRPLGPRGRSHYVVPGVRHNLPRDHRRAGVRDAHWRFATTSDFARPHIRAHLYRNPAEGLRVTARVNALPLRARTTVRAGDLMRNRYVGVRTGRVGGGRDSRPGQAIRPDQRYQPYGPQRPYAPGSRSLRPQPDGRVRPYDRQPVDRVQPYDRGPNRVQPYDRGPNRAQPYERGPRYNPGVRTYQPGPQPGRVAPTGRQPYNPGTRTYQPDRANQPPARTFSPGSPSGAPVRTWSPPSGPSRSGGSPSQSWSPPSRASDPAPSAPSRSSAPSSSGSRNDSGGSRNDSGGSRNDSGGRNAGHSGGRSRR